MNPACSGTKVTFPSFIPEPAVPAASCNPHQEPKLKKNHRRQQHQAVRTRGLTSRERQEVADTLWPVQNPFHLALHPTRTGQHKASSSSLLLWGADWCFPTWSQMPCSAQASHDGLQTSGPLCTQNPREGLPGQAQGDNLQPAIKTQPQNAERHLAQPTARAIWPLSCSLASPRATGRCKFGAKPERRDPGSRQGFSAPAARAQHPPRCRVARVQPAQSAGTARSAEAGKMYASRKKRASESLEM